MRISTGFIMPITMFFSPIFHYERDFCLNIILTKNETNAHYILFKDGFIIIIDSNLLQRWEN